MHIKDLHVLLVEDNEGDIVLTTEAFEDVTRLKKLSIARDGEQAIEFLNSSIKLKGTKSPDLIILDINLPKMNGHEVLKYVKNHEELKTIPVIMLTTSSSENDISESYKNNASCYIIKPLEFTEYLNTIKVIEEHWLKVVKYSNSIHVN